MTLTLEKAKEALRIEADITENDEVISDLLLAIPESIYQQTGMTLTQQQHNKLADQCQVWMLRQQYFQDGDMKVQRVIDSMLKTLSGMVEAGVYAELNVTENGFYAAEGDIDGWHSVMVDVQPKVCEKVINANGTYECTADSVQGYSRVMVAVPENVPELDTLVVTSPGEYSADSELVYGWDRVVVDIETKPIVDALEASENGLYYAKDAGLDGYEVVHVNVPTTETELLPLAVTANGTYEPEAGKGFGTVSVNVPLDGGGVETEELLWRQRYLNLMGDGNGDEIYFPETMAKINAYAFYNKGELTGDLIIPDGVYTIGERAFYMCMALGENFRIPSTVNTLGVYAFYMCQNLKGALELPDNLSIIPNSAFYSCKGFTSLKLPANATQIDNYAFYNCTGLSGDVELPDTLNTIANYAFQGCQNIDNFVIRRTDKLITLNGSQVFSNTKLTLSKTGYVYVPDALVDSYKAASNWSVVSAQIKPLSEYAGGAA